MTARADLLNLMAEWGLTTGKGSREIADRILGAHAHEQAGNIQLTFATEFRIPCPEPSDPNRPANAPVLRPEPLIVQKIAAHWADRFPDGWRIVNPNLEPGDQVWTGDGWVYCGQLHIGVIYRWTRDEAVGEAQRLAVQETARYETWLAEMRSSR